VYFERFHLIGGKGGAGSSSLRTMMEGTDGVCESKMDVKVYLETHVASNGSRFVVTWSPSWRSNTKPGDHGTPNAHDH
jgi:hypothetical protein